MALSRRATVLPAPIGMTPSQAWQGNDQETWVPVPAGCTINDPSDCGAERGVYPFDGLPSSGFQVNSSSTWSPIGLYSLGLDSNLNYTGIGEYGFDTVGLDLPNSGGVSLTQQIVAGIADKSFYLGMLGLGPKPTNFTNFNEPQPSLFWSLRNKTLIPSLTWSYTAGASYEQKQVPGSLTFGGYDASRFTPNNITFSFAADDSKPLTLGLQKIEASTSFQGVMSLLPQGILAFIDSTVPELWLPVAACAIFETAFGLEYDNITGRYLVNDTTHANLTSMNPQLTIKLGNTVSGGNTTTITLPYAAFDLTASYPIYQNATKYFPLRRATVESQYTLGRVFLQEAYVIADFDRGNFSVSQAVFQTNNPSDIISIFPPTISTSHSGLSKGAMIGIIVVVVVVALILSSIGFILYKHRQAKKERRELEEEVKVADATTGEGQPFVGGELDSDVHGNWIHEVKGSAVEDRPRELSGIDVYKAEMQGTEMVYRNGHPSPVSPLNREAVELPTERHDRG